MKFNKLSMTTKFITLLMSATMWNEAVYFNSIAYCNCAIIAQENPADGGKSSAKKASLYVTISHSMCA